MSLISYSKPSGRGARDTALHDERKALSDLDSLRARRAILDAQIDRTTHDLFSARARINATSPACWPPFEVLVFVFELLAVEQPAGLSGYPGNARQGMLGWIVVTHVCSRWRQVALEAPALWATLTRDLGSEWLDRMVARSQNMPLSLALRLLPVPHKKPWMDWPVFIIDLSPRLRSLSICGELHALSIYQLLSMPAPLLEKLELHSNSEWDGQDPLFDGCTPLLREVSISGCLQPWALIHTESVTRLTVSWVEHRWSTAGIRIPCRCDQFMDLMTRSYKLEHLILNRRGVSCNCKFRAVQLPSLATLTLRGAWHGIVWTLDRVVVPASAKVHVYAFYLSREDRACAQILAAVKRLLHSNPTEVPSFRTLAIDCDRNVLLITADRRTLPNPDLPFKFLEDDPGLLLRFTQECIPIVGDPSDDPFIILKGVRNTLALWDLRALSLDFRSSNSRVPLTGRDWSTIFESCTVLAHLRVYGVRASRIFDALAVHTEATAATQDANIPFFPGLRSLMVRDIDADDLGEEHYGDQTPWYTRLSRNLKSRLSVNTRLELLDIGRCVFCENQLQLFEDIVGAVVWDGESGGHDKDYVFAELSDVWSDRTGDKLLLESDSALESQGPDDTDSDSEDLDVDSGV
ncbi:hypothetical protein BV25DRAFT_1918462 [Artomyces pyxidatus]|uniref:Uncharacterized protein n=1 Tax=Artomyces pyxidatus TaxID=48021 RepID=A0ACB8ST90_9AGAM|nr:hypothetical protein BV25DRAFT_1918462 [Artomyces pyxidatus]